MRVLITGANGFVGKHVASALLNIGHDVVALDHTPGGEATAKLQYVQGDLGNRECRALALGSGCDAVLHLATVPGGAAEADPVSSRRINVDAMYDLILESAALNPGVRFVYASSIAVFGDPLPSIVDDQTPISPRLVYGGHKAMMEAAIAMYSNRGAIDGVTVRLPGVLARPKGPSGLKSAFMSDLFHAMRAKERFICPVSQDGTIWAQSVECCVSNFLNALGLNSDLLPVGRSVTLPALRLRMGDLINEVALQCDAPVALVSYEPDIDLEATFATQPSLATPAAMAAGFTDDGNVASLVRRALRTLA